MRISPINLTLVVSRLLRQDIEAPKERYDWHDEKAEEPEHAVLGSRSRPAFKLLHDFILFSGVGVLTRPLKHIHQETNASARWLTGHSRQQTSHADEGDDRQLRIAWQVYPWTTFWQQDIFNDLWNHNFETARACMRRSSKINETELFVFLALAWLSSTLVTLDAQPGDLGLFSWRDTKAEKRTALEEAGRLLSSVEIISPKKVDDPKRNAATEDSDADRKDRATAFTDACNAVLNKAFDTLVARMRGNKLDAQTRVLKMKLTELILLCMPESGPMMFSLQNIAAARAGMDHTPQHLEQCFVKIAGMIAKVVMDLLVEAAETTEASNEAMKTKRVLFQDMMRNVREKRVERMGAHLASHFGIGLLLFDSKIVKGKLGDTIFNTDDTHSFRQSFTRADKTPALGEDILKLYAHSRPSLNHLRTALAQTRAKALGNRVEHLDLVGWFAQEPDQYDEGDLSKGVILREWKRLERSPSVASAPRNPDPVRKRRPTPEKK